MSTTTITIREKQTTSDNGWLATISFNHGPEYDITLQDPFTPAEEERLGWYFEEWPRFPFTGQIKARKAAAATTTYGENLFQQLFVANANVLADYKMALRDHGHGAFTFDIRGGLGFHALHWEALKDPQHGRPFAVECPFLRQNSTPPNLHAPWRPAPTLNVLLVTARPSGRQDVAYRTISRPLVESLHNSRLRAQIDLVRPGTYKALIHHLEEARDKHGAGYYHLIHFDLHGGLLTYDQYERMEQSATNDAASRWLYKGYGQNALEAYEGLKAFLLFEGEETGRPDLVSDADLADLLQAHQIPVAVLNACQSGKQVGDAETSLGQRLMEAGVQQVIAMGYSVSVTAAELLMSTLYTQLLAEKPLAVALRQARLALYNDKTRRATYNQRIELEDWLLPVAYQNRPVRVQVAPFADAAQEAAHYEQMAARTPAPTPTYGFWGRDVDILEIEKRLLGAEQGSNRLLIQGMGGAGKTTLLRHLMYWWQTTRLVEKVIYFGYDQKAYNLPQILDGVARAVYNQVEFAREFLPFSDTVKAQKLTAKLRAERHLLVLDNLESITGAALSIQHTLDEQEQVALRDWLATLAGGRTFVLCGSRGREEWLNVPALYELPGLDPEAASNMVEAILQQHGVAHYRSDEAHRDALRQLLKLLDGYPLALEIVLANLARQTPQAVLDAFTRGAAGIDSPEGGTGALWQDKTASILRCVEYSHSNLSPEAQALLACLAPFTGVIRTEWLPQYTAQLQKQEALADLPFDRWGTVLQEAVNWGLLTQHEVGGGYLRLQPILPYFLRQRLAEPQAAEQETAVLAAFRAHYDGVGEGLVELARSKEAGERQLGQALIGLEYENLIMALRSALATHQPFGNYYDALGVYLRARQEFADEKALCELILAEQDNYPAEEMQAEIGSDFFKVYGNLGNRNFQLKAYDAARGILYSEALELLPQLTAVTREQRGQLEAITHHQLGMVAEEQREWDTAVHHYQQALQIYIEFNDRYRQASTYGQLGMVAQKQRDLDTAVHHYQQALQIFVEYKDRHPQATIHHQLGMVAEEQREWDTAVDHYQQALQIYIEFNDRYEQAKTYHQLGMVAQEQREWDTAVDHYQQALQIKIDFTDRYGQAGTYGQLGNMAQAQQQWDTAMHHYQQALQIFVEFSDRYNQAKTHLQLGNVAFKQREWDTAENHYQQALQIKIEFNDRYEQAGTYGQLGLLAEAQEKWPEAANYLLQALEIFVPYNDEHSGIALRSLARVWQAATAERPTIEAGLAKRLGFPPAVAQALLQRAASDNA